MSAVPTDLAVNDRRGNKPSIPANIKQLLTPEQTLALHRIEGFGWQLAFVRQPLFESPVAVVVGPDRHKHAVLEADGEVNTAPTITLRP